MAIVISGVNNNDKITASDGTIDLLSGVSYAGIITAPAFTTPGNLTCLLYTSPSPRDGLLSRMPSSA